MTMLPRSLLLDTHAAIWLVEGQLSPGAVEAVVHAGLADGVFVSPVSAWEVGLLARPKPSGAPGPQFLPDPQSWFAALMAKAIIKSAPLTPSAAIAASFLPGTVHGDPADRLLIAMAREMNVALMTRDREILAYGDAGHVRTYAC